MDKYIKKETAIKSLLNDCLGQVSYSREDAADCIFWLDTADVAPVRHGRWVFGKDLPENWGQLFKNKYHLYCSECKEQAHNKSEDNNPDFDIDTPYCPWCGAIMDLED